MSAMTFEYVTRISGRDVREQVSWIMANIERFKIDNFNGYAPPPPPDPNATGWIRSGWIYGDGPMTVTFFSQDDAAKFKLFFGDD
jgi:hypothetical protein